MQTKLMICDVSTDEESNSETLNVIPGVTLLRDDFKPSRKTITDLRNQVLTKASLKLCVQDKCERVKNANPCPNNFRCKYVVGKSKESLRLWRREIKKVGRGLTNSISKRFV
jgi:hypothetical protein